MSPPTWSNSQLTLYQITSLLRIQNNIDICEILGALLKKKLLHSGTGVRPGFKESAILTIYGPW